MCLLGATIILYNSCATYCCCCIHDRYVLHTAITYLVLRTLESISIMYQVYPFSFEGLRARNLIIYLCALFFFRALIMRPERPVIHLCIFMYVSVLFQGSPCAQKDRWYIWSLVYPFSFEALTRPQSTCHASLRSYSEPFGVLVRARRPVIRLCTYIFRRVIRLGCRVPTLSTAPGNKMASSSK